MHLLLASSCLDFRGQRAGFRARLLVGLREAVGVLCSPECCIRHLPHPVPLQVINERDILGTQLIRRNDELALLYEKLKIQQSTLKKVTT